VIVRSLLKRHQHPHDHAVATIAGLSAKAQPGHLSPACPNPGATNRMVVGLIRL
jgi:hypothetical protein